MLPNLLINIQVPSEGNKLIKTETHSQRAFAAGHFLWQEGMLLQRFDLPQVRLIDGSIVLMARVGVGDGVDFVSLFMEAK